MERQVPKHIALAAAIARYMQIYVPLTAMPRRGEVWSLGATHLLCWREIAVEASWGGRIGVYGEDPKTECSGNTIGIYLRQGGLVLLGDLVPDLLGGTYNERNRMNAIIKGGKFV